MGRIKDKHDKNKRKDQDTDPLSGSLGGDTDQDTNDYDIDDDTIEDQQNKE